MKIPITSKSAAMTTYFERYVLSVVYLYFAWREWTALELLSRNWSVHPEIGSPQVVVAIKHSILLTMQFFIGLMLATSRRPSTEPRNLKEILVPLAASFFFLAYNFLHAFPVPLRHNLFSASAQMPCAVFGLIFGIIGPVISIWGVMSLGRSFGIFVSVRSIVLCGPYQYVRHPIYLGYVCIWTGLVLVNFSAAILLIVTIHLLLFIWRARLEEVRLCDSSAEYREYVKHVGFLFPKLDSLRNRQRKVPAKV